MQEILPEIQNTLQPLVMKNSLNLYDYYPNKSQKTIFYKKIKIKTIS